MKLIKKLAYSLLIVSSVMTVSACSLFGNKDNHTHTWKNYIVKSPTCTAAGLLEKLCEECGEKEYEEIVKTDHNFQDGVCSVCGTSGQSGTSINPIPMPTGANNTAAWSMEKIHETALSLGFKGDYNQFIHQIATGTGVIQDVYVDNLGMFHLNVSVTNTDGKNFEFPLAFIIGRVSPTNSQVSDLENVYKAKIKNNEMMITYSDGLQVSAGRVQDTYGAYITGFGLNTNNELVIYYSDNTIAFAGKLLIGDAPENQASFAYRAVDGGYHIAEVFNSATEVLIIPTSHRGKPIIGIDDNAFKNLTSSVTAVVIPETVTDITSTTFSGLSLASVFNANGTRLYFEGTSPFGSNVNLPMDFAYSSYFKGEWSYVNGVPTPNN